MKSIHHSRGRVLMLLVASLLIGRCAFGATDFNSAHPLDPLSKEEIAAAVSVLKAEGKATDTSRFPMIVLREPSKLDVASYKPGGSSRREAFVVVFERATNKTFEAVVDRRRSARLGLARPCWAGDRRDRRGSRTPTGLVLAGPR